MLLFYRKAKSQKYIVFKWNIYGLNIVAVKEKYQFQCIMLTVMSLLSNTFLPKLLYVFQIANLIGRCVCFKINFPTFFFIFPRALHMTRTPPAWLGP